MAINAPRHADFEPSPPADLLNEIVIPGSGLSKSEIARRLGISRQTLYDVLDKKQPVTPNLAARLGKMFGNGPAIWLRMQASYDAWHAEREIDVSDIETVRAA